MSIALKRVYEATNVSDGQRILIDRVWPRGLSKEKAQIDEWTKQVAPSKELRQWFQHDPDKFQAFKEAYESELYQNEEQNNALHYLQAIVKQQENVTLVYAAKEETYNHAHVLKEVLERE